MVYFHLIKFVLHKSHVLYHIKPELIERENKNL